MPVSVHLTRLPAVALAAVLACAVPVPGGSTLQAQDTRPATEAQFRDWLAQTVWPDAEKQGVSRATFERSLPMLRLDWELPELMPPGRAAPPDDQRQAEFRSPGLYFVEAQLASLAKDGRELLRRWGSALDGIERRYGVPREIVVAIWGRESHFGRVKAQHPALRVLATQAFMGRRRALYYPELLAALVILEEDHFSGETLLSSWAGAMGQPQLLPSKFLRYAVDADADGRRDIWLSVPDSLASIANYLREHGWKPEVGWGFEVSLPEAVSCTLEGPGQGRPMQEWRQLGLKPVGGKAVPEWSSDTTAFLVMPAGRLGPAFLVSENFYVLKRYNESDLYALFIGNLADRMGGASGFAGRWQPVDSLRRGDIQAMQERLKGQDYDVGKVDGLVGFATRTAVGRWQIKNRRAETCFPDGALVQAIR
ncbi:lytic murein transglycosylase [Microvirga sp. CF3016]|uniref:lytic murein transglycosylase n=1 Tax=Microvirga sp. CF3016 TaxID=3110181 RepID=UPI002E76D137|nr:lytic murein transglycosylase [Microvirga sp. CF3016]MEE1610907.1 lytic murein transglycosylase [Microvirga sp. CF3016]